MEEQGKVCSKCGVWKPLEEYCKYKRNKDGRCSYCKECKNKYNKQWRENNPEYNKQWHENNKEHKKEYNKQWRRNNGWRYKEYEKQWKEANKERVKEQYAKWKENNKDKMKEYDKQWRENNKEQFEEYHKRYREVNKDKIKQWKEANKERVKEYNKIYHREWDKNNNDKVREYKRKEKENNLIKIANLLDQINPFFKQLNLPVYGYIYKFENVKTRHVYIGQSIRPLKERYKGGIVKSWIKDRLKKQKQNFKDELIEEDIEVTEVLDVACCQYHLNILEANYITKYDSYNNGYNNNAGHYKDDTGKEEFEQILKENGLQFIDGKLIAI